MNDGKVKCQYCRKNVYFYDAVFYNGDKYHQSCFISFLRKEISLFDIKFKRGIITLDEAKLMQEYIEIKECYEKSPENNTEIFLNSKLNHEPRFFGNTPFLEDKIRQKALSDGLEKKRKLLKSDELNNDLII